MDDILEDWPESLDIFGSVWLDALDRTRPAENWFVCLNLMEHLFLDLLSHMDFLLEHQAVCVNILGPQFADDPYMWMFFHTWKWTGDVTRQKRCCMSSEQIVWRQEHPAEWRGYFSASTWRQRRRQISSTLPFDIYIFSLFVFNQ